MFSLTTNTNVLGSCATGLYLLNQAMGTPTNSQHNRIHKVTETKSTKISLKEFDPETKSTDKSRHTKWATLTQKKETTNEIKETKKSEDENNHELSDLDNSGPPPEFTVMYVAISFIMVAMLCFTFWIFVCVCRQLHNTHMQNMPTPIRVHTTPVETHDTIPLIEKGTGNIIRVIPSYDDEPSAPTREQLSPSEPPSYQSAVANYQTIATAEKSEK